MKRKPDPLEELARKEQHGVARNLAELRWQLLQAALRREWETYENLRQQLNPMGFDIPAHSTNQEN